MDLARPYFSVVGDSISTFQAYSPVGAEHYAPDLASATGVASAYFYFDGSYRGTYTKDILGSTSALMHFSEGMHSITFYLKDGYGNVTRETRYFNVVADDAKLPAVKLDVTGAPTVGSKWKLTLTGSDLTSITALSADISVTRSYPATVIFPDGVTGTYNYNAAKGLVTVEISGIDHTVFKAGGLATVLVDVPTSVTEGSSINVRVTKGSYGCKQTEGLDISDVNQYAAGFSTQLLTYPVEAIYRIQADTAVVGSKATAVVTVIKDGKVAAGVGVYANDALLGTTDDKGEIDISTLTATQGDVKLRAADAQGNCSFQIMLYSYDAVGDEAGTPYNISFNLTKAQDGKTITWMSHPTNSADRAVVELSVNADMSGAEQVTGTTRLISYSSSKQINRVSTVALTGLEDGKTYYFRVGDGSKWSDVDSFTVPAVAKETNFFLLADIQEEAALEGMGRIAAKLNGAYGFGIQLGDAVDNVRYYNQWNDALGLFAVDGIRNTDILHVIGNHEADDDGNNSIAAKTVFGVPAPWYSVERGDVYIAVLNHTSEKDKLQEFAQWLVEDAAKTDCTWKIVVTHVPAYYTNPTGGGENYIEYLPTACDAAGIDFYFAGNDHSYARTKAMKGGQVDESGTVYYICGSTGGKSYSIVDNKDFHFDIATLDFESVYVDVTANKNEIVVTAYNIDTNGNRTVLDTYQKGVHYCDNDEHTYVYDRTTDALTCSVCPYETTAAGEMYSGWATDAANGKYMYFASGKYVTGVIKIASVIATYFDADGYAYDGIYTIDGNACRFEKGLYVGCDTAEVITAGYDGGNVTFILYKDGELVLDGEGRVNDFTIPSAPLRNFASKIKSIYIGKEITYIGKYFFPYAAATRLTFEEGSGLNTIGGGAFEFSSLETAIVPQGTERIVAYAFAHIKHMLQLELPDTINYIDPKAFVETANLTLVVKEGSYAHKWATENNVNFAFEYVKKNGPAADGYFYLDDIMQHAYQLIEFEGSYYYISNCHKYTVNKTVYLAKDVLTGTDFQPGYFTFGEDGKMVIKN